MNRLQFAVVAALACFAAGSALAQDDAAAAAPWGVACAGDAGAQVCSVRQELFMATTEAADSPLARLLTVAVQPDRGGADSLVLSLPHGVLFPAGVFAGVDGATPTAVTVQTSDETGALAGIPLTPELLASMRAGAEMQVTFSSVDGQTYTLPVTLEDFGPAYDRMKAGVADPVPAAAAAPAQ